MTCLSSRFDSAPMCAGHAHSGGIPMDRFLMFVLYNRLMFFIH